MRSFSDDILLGRSQCPTDLEELVRFFRESLCSDQLRLADISIEGYNCVQSFFLLSNLLIETIIVKDNDVKKSNLGRNKLHSATSYRTLMHDKIET